MVKSKSGSAPHLISVNGFKYECDDKCPHFRSVKLCSHAVAALEINGELREFMNWFKTKCSCDSPNLMQLGTHGMPVVRVVKWQKRNKQQNDWLHLMKTE